MSDRRYDRLCDIAGPVSRETFERLVRYEAMLRRWNSRINLVGSTTLDNFWDRHIVDSAQLAPLLPIGADYVDLGSGAGLPGVVAALLRSPSRVELVESNRKKAAFLRAVSIELDIGLIVTPERIEKRLAAGPKPEFVGARALANLSALLEMAAPWLSHGTVGLFHKGRDYQGEVQQSLQHWQFDLIEHASRVEPGAAILAVANLRRLN